MSYSETLNQAWQDHLAPKLSDAPTVISTFAGCGGSSLGYSSAGYRELLAVEWDKHAVETFRHNFPDIPIYHGDIAKLSVEQCLEMAQIKTGELDVFDGSPPCFPGSTLISTREGSKPIEKIQIGDFVLTHLGNYQEVESVHSRDYTGELLMIEPRYGRDYLTCTPNHPLFAKRKRYRQGDERDTQPFCYPEWIPAQELKAGDLLLEPGRRESTELKKTYPKPKHDADGATGYADNYGVWIPIKRIHKTVPVSCKVYNLEVKQDCSYTANGFAVHNCQGFSTSGKRAFTDNRNQLFKEYVRLLRGLKPKVFVMENVSGMVKGKMKLIFAEIMKELKASGYQVSVRLLNASHYGVPQARERVIFIGVRNDLGLSPSHPLGDYHVVTAKEALRDCTPSEIVPLVGKNLAKMQLIRPGAPYKEKKRASMAIFGKVSGFTLIRFKWNAPAPTILKTVCVSPTFGAGLIMPDEDRYCSIAELKRLASLPDQFEITGKFEERWARIGNSVPPLLMRSIALHIRNEILRKLLPAVS